MNFLAAGAVGAKAAQQAQEPAGAKAAARAKAALSLYTDLPDGEIAIEEFERFAMDRLRGEQCCGLGCEMWRRRRRSVAAAGCTATAARRNRPLRPLLPAVLKGIDDLKAKGFRHEQMQVPQCCGRTWRHRRRCFPPAHYALCAAAPA